MGFGFSFLNPFGVDIDPCLLFFSLFILILSRSGPAV